MANRIGYSGPELVVPLSLRKFRAGEKVARWSWFTRILRGRHG